MNSPAVLNTRTQYKLIKPVDSPLNEAFDEWVEAHQPCEVVVLPATPQGEPIWVILHDLTGEREFEADLEAQFWELMVETQEETFDDPDVIALMELAISNGVTRW